MVQSSCFFLSRYRNASWVSLGLSAPYRRKNAKSIRTKSVSLEASWMEGNWARCQGRWQEVCCLNQSDPCVRVRECRSRCAASRIASQVFLQFHGPTIDVLRRLVFRNRNHDSIVGTTHVRAELIPALRTLFCSSQRGSLHSQVEVLHPADTSSKT